MVAILDRVLQAAYTYQNHHNALPSSIVISNGGYAELYAAMLGMVNMPTSSLQLNLAHYKLTIYRTYDLPQGTQFILL